MSKPITTDQKLNFFKEGLKEMSRQDLVKLYFTVNDEDLLFIRYIDIVNDEIERRINYLNK